MSEKRFEIKLWLMAVLASLFLFGVTKFIWREVNDALLLVYLIVVFLMNVLISKIRDLSSRNSSSYK